MKISIFIPTANRPGMLRTALHSVVEQTALADVGEVIVIENLGNRESENVCREFPQLPIHYVFRDPPIPPEMQTPDDTMRHINYEYMAVLFDDDWWMPEHLENLIQSLESRTDAVAASCAYLMVTGEEGYIVGVGGSFLPCFATTSPLINHRRIFKLPDLLVANQIATAFAFMTILVKTDVWMKCLEAMPRGNTYDTDRLMFVELGRYGTLVHDMRPHVSVRSHPGQECARQLDSRESLHWWNNSTRRLHDLANAEKIDLRREFSIRMSEKKIDVETLRQHSHYNSVENLIEMGIIPFHPPFQAESPPLWKRFYHAVTAPILQRLPQVIRRGQGI